MSDRLPDSVIRQAANELLVTIVMKALYDASLMLADDCDIAQSEANAILVEKLVQFTTKHPVNLINPDTAAIYFNCEVVEDETINYTPSPLTSDIGSMSWLESATDCNSFDDSEDNESGLTVAA